MNIIDTIKEFFAGRSNSATQLNVVEMRKPGKVGDSAGEINTRRSPPHAVIAKWCERCRKTVQAEHVTVADPTQLSRYTNGCGKELKHIHKGPFDPVNNPMDAAMEKSRAQKQTAFVQEQNAYGRASMELQEARAQERAAEPRPQQPTPIIFAATCGFTILFALTFNELPLLLRAVPDVKARLLMAAIPGFIFAMLMTFSTFNVRTHSDNATSIFTKAGLQNFTWNALAGVVLILSMSGTRMVLTTGWREKALSLTLGAVEFALWAYAKAAAVRSTAENDEYDRRHDGDPQRTLNLLRAEETHDKKREALAEAAAELEAERQKRAEREEYDFLLDAAIEYARREIEAVYFDSISENLGRRTFHKSMEAM